MTEQPPTPEPLPTIEQKEEDPSLIELEDDEQEEEGWAAEATNENTEELWQTPHKEDLNEDEEEPRFLALTPTPQRFPDDAFREMVVLHESKKLALQRLLAMY